MELLNELYAMFEKVTPGLDMGGFLLDTKKGTIVAKIGNKVYEFTPKEKDATDLHKSVVGVAKHSQGRALAYLKQHATGVPLGESIEEHVDIVEDLADQTEFKNLVKFESAVAHFAASKKMKTWSITPVAGVHVYHLRSKYFAAWSPEKKRGIIDPDFKGTSTELIDQMEKD